MEDGKQSPPEETREIRTRFGLVGQRARLAIAFGGVLLFAIAAYVARRPAKSGQDDDLRAYQRKVKVLVKGDEAFQRKVCDALQLLEQRDPDTFTFVTQRVSIVRPGIWDYTESLSDPPIVCLSNGVQSSVTWCAATLLHEATHIQQIVDSRNRHGGVWMGTDVVGKDPERACVVAELEFLRRIGAPTGEISSLEKFLLVESNLVFRPVGFPKLPGSNDVGFTFPLSQVDPKLWTELQRLVSPSRH